MCTSQLSVERYLRKRVTQQTVAVCAKTSWFEENMVKSVLRVGILLVVLCVADGQRAMPEDSLCSYTFNVPASECSYMSREDRLLESSMIDLQAQVRLLASKLTDENEKLQQEIATIKAVNTDTREEVYATLKIKLRGKPEVPATVKVKRDTGAKGSVLPLRTYQRAVERSDRSTVNLKQCSRRGLGEGKENGLVYSCEFVKKRNDTVLRVVWNGDLRLIHTGPKSCSCRRWFFTINGGECSEPRTIETQLYINTRGTNIHRPAYVEGYCRGVSAGHVNVGWNVGDCQNMNAYNVGDSSTGYKATVRIIVEEVDVEDANTVIV